MADTLIPSIPSQQRVPVRHIKAGKLTILIKPFSSLAGLGPELMAPPAEPSESVYAVVSKPTDDDVTYRAIMTMKSHDLVLTGAAAEKYADVRGRRARRIAKPLPLK
jgi:hypothetical protein